MWSPVFIYELHSPTNCLSTYQYHRLFYFKVRLGQKKSIYYFHLWDQPSLHARYCFLDFTESYLPSQIMVVYNTEGLHPSSEHKILKTSQIHNFTSSDLAHFLTKIFHTHAHTNTHTHPHKISSLGSSRILIIKSRCKYVKLWTSLSVSVLMGHQNFSSTVGQQLSQPAFTCSKLTKETIQQVVKSVQS